MSLRPDHVFESTWDITPEFFEKQGITAVISDIDNTLITYDDACPTPRCLKWLELMKISGVKIAFLSNNTQERADIFNDKLGYPCKGKANKPLTGGAKKLLTELGIPKNKVCVLGDQIFTDTLCGKLLGVRTVLVSPIKDKTDSFTKFKRYLEKKILH